MTKDDFTNYSGGANGADMMWDTMGRKHGFNNHIHFRPDDYLKTPFEVQEHINDAVESAAEVLKRPMYFNGINLVRRNWFQQNKAETVYAVSRIINPNEFDKGKYKNKTGKQIVSGGTGWTVEMAIQNNKGVYVFDMLTNFWYKWDYNKIKFERLFVIPYLTQKYAGIGSTSLTLNGKMHIESVYQMTETVHKLYL